MLNLRNVGTTERGWLRGHQKPLALRWNLHVP